MNTLRFTPGCGGRKPPTRAGTCPRAPQLLGSSTATGFFFARGDGAATVTGSAAVFTNFFESRAPSGSTAPSPPEVDTFRFGNGRHTPSLQ